MKENDQTENTKIDWDTILPENVEEQKLSPMMKQYFEVKAKYPNTLVFFRLGDFYEMFYNDAKLASRELELTLTARDCGQEFKAPMCGVPHHSCENYIAKLVEKGYKIAICEQLEEPGGKGIVKRDVVRVFTPGTLIENSMLDESKNNFICSLISVENTAGLCFCDISTGEIFATEINTSELTNAVKSELVKFSPKEIIINGSLTPLKDIWKFIEEKTKCFAEIQQNPLEPWQDYKNLLQNQFTEKELMFINFKSKNSLFFSLAFLIKYLNYTQKQCLSRLKKITLYDQTEFMFLDATARKNLELLETIKKHGKNGSLLSIIDKAKTSMGKRLIRTIVEQPLLRIKDIQARLDGTEDLFNNIVITSDIEDVLVNIHDLHRLMTRLVAGTSNARELRSLAFTFSKLPDLKNLLKNFKSDLLVEIFHGIDDLADLRDLIDKAILEEPPITIKDGGMIKPGYDSKLDLLREDLDGGNNILLKIQEKEKKENGINKLKVGYNKVFGYYIEVPNGQKNKVPAHYLRKQTLANCERYITPELKEIEIRIVGAKEKACEMEYSIFNEIKEIITCNLDRIQNTANNIAMLDVLVSFACVAYDNGYTKPIINSSDRLIIKDGRHPVVENTLKKVPFVPNDTTLDLNESRIAIITGPNMAGKSTYMRQSAIIVLMAQIGSFVPASFAEIGIVDAIFTRVGASDDLAGGQSTFMVEMSEMANIIASSTSKSLLILDEIGRGTSTFDGMSIAKSVIEYLATNKNSAKTLFATHYHELTELQDVFPVIQNYNIAVKKRGDEIVFLRKIVRGGADDSFGIEVAKLAGLPDVIIDRAKEILAELENENISFKNKKEKILIPIHEDITPEISQIFKKIKDLEISTLTPIESMNILYELNNLAKEIIKF